LGARKLGAPGVVREVAENNSPPRILHVIDSLVLGGAESFLTALVGELSRTRLTRNAVCAFTPDAADPSLIIRLRIHAEALSLVPASRVHDPRLLLGVLQVARRHGAQLIHSHLSGATITARMAGVILSVPVVTTVHTIPGPTAEDNRARQVAERLTESLSTTIVAPSPEVAAGYASARRRPVNTVRVIPNGPAAEMPPRSFDRALYRHDVLDTDQSPVVTCVARLEPEKAIDDLIRAVAVLRPTYPRIALLIAGDGPEKNRLRDLSVHLGLGDSVRLLGRRDDVGALLTSSDAFCLPSHYEGLPVSILEALAAGTPVVATKVGGIPGLLDDGETAVLVPPGDVTALSGALEKLLGDEVMRRRLAQAGRELVEQHYSIASVARQYAELYSSLISARTRTRC
jgi:L-malate glycosyltransferase